MTARHQHRLLEPRAVLQSHLDRSRHAVRIRSAETAAILDGDAADQVLNVGAAEPVVGEVMQRRRAIDLVLAG